MVDVANIVTNGLLNSASIITHRLCTIFSVIVLNPDPFGNLLIKKLSGVCERIQQYPLPLLFTCWKTRHVLCK